jgi:putative transposase
LVWAAHVGAASVQDRDGALPLLAQLSYATPSLQKLFADGAYAGFLVDYVDYATEGAWNLEIVKKPEDQKGFVVLPKRWVVERTFAWNGKYRRLSKDYEARTETTEAWIYWASVHRMVRRLVKPNTS